MHSVPNIIQAVAQHNKLLSWVLKSNQIIFDGDQQLNSDQLTILALGTIAATQQLSLVIEHPHPTANLGISAALGVLLADFFGRKTGAYGALFRNDLIYITRQIGIGLSQFQSVRLAGQAVQGIWSAESGRSASQRTGHGSPRVLVSSPQPKRIRTYAESGSALVIDASHPLTIQRIADILLDSNIQDAQTRIVITPLGFLSQTDVFDDWSSWVCRDTQNRKNFQVAHVKQSILLSEDDNLDPHLAKAREKLGTLSKHSYKNPSSHLLRAWGVYNRLASLAVSLGRYEDHAHRHRMATPIRVRLDNLANVQINGSRQHVWISEWPVLIQSLKLAYESLKGRESGKYWALANFLETEIVSGFSTSVSVICPTQLEANLLIRELGYVISDLHQYLHPEALSVTSIKTFAGQTIRTDKVIYIGSPSSRWRYLNMIVADQYKVLYPHEVPIEKYTIGRIIKGINRRAQINDWHEILGAFEPKAVLVDYPDQSAEIQTASIQFDVSQITASPKLVSPVRVENPDLYTPQWAWDAEDITFVPPLTSGKVNTEYRTLTSTTNDWVEITFEDGRTITVPCDETLDVFRRVTNELEECLAEHIEVGDVIIIVIDGNYTSIFERIVEALEVHPNYALLGVWINLWNITKLEALERCDHSVKQLHGELCKKGAEITAQAVRTWFSGIMAPQSDEIVFNIIEISENKSAIKHASEIRRSLGHLRGMRRKVGRKLRQIIRSATIHDHPEKLVNSIDELVLEDVLSAAERVVVKRISKFI